ncbi:MAG: long-chain acyl-CoA synthetase [Thermoleophilaceae bacterium]|jgi:long-chain acyl-CoA synthetase|nr:long-chain acyl-CoA synthetase [Thermoleophilaceae bacterium]
MEAATGAKNALEMGTQTRTIAAEVPAAVAKHSAHVAQMYKHGGDWAKITYEDMGTASREIALGLLDLGIQPRDRVAILSHTRPEWTWANFGTVTAGATSVSIYQTNSPEECRYVLEHSESVAVFAEDEEQLAKIRAVREHLPALRHVIAFEPGSDSDGVITLEELRERGRGRDEAEWQQAAEAVKPEDPCQFIYTSGTTGPPKGCVITHGNYAAMRDMVLGQGAVEEQDAVYLYLPLAHSFALLIQFLVLDVGGTIAYWQKDPTKIVPDLQEVRPHYFPSVPRIFEKIYTLATSNAPDAEQLEKAVALGVKVREMQQRGEEIPAELQEPFDQAEEALYKNVRAIFGGRVRQGVSGAAPIAKEVLEFFYACGIPIFEGYGMTETSTAATAQTLDSFRFGSVGRILEPMEAKIAEDGELLLRGPNIFEGYYKNEEATREALEDGWLHTGDLAHIDEDGFVFITGRKKDIIITAGGKNITPANLENGLKQNRYISQAVVLGDRKPYLVALITLDPDEVPGFAEQHGLAPEEVPESEQMRAEVQKVMDEVNAQVGRVEQVKKFKILPEDLSQATGELTPTMKVKRNVVAEKFADTVESFYSS